MEALTPIQQLKSDFPRHTRRKGEDYYRRNLVQIVDSEPGRIRARVQGTALYDVNVGWDDVEYHYHCSCPYFVDEGEPCKHLWATLLAADAKGILPDDADQPDDDVDDSEEAEEAEEEQFVPEIRTLKIGNREVELLRFRETHPPAHAKPQRHAVWRRRLTEMRRAGRGEINPPRLAGRRTSRSSMSSRSRHRGRRAISPFSWVPNFRASPATSGGFACDPIRSITFPKRSTGI